LVRKTDLTPKQIAALPYRACVGVVLTDGRGRVFTGQRIDSDLPAWQMPQGGIDAGETVREAGLRELWEETGVTEDKVTWLGEADDWVTYDLPHEIVPRIWKGRFKGQKQKWVLLRFSGEDGEIDISGPPPEFSTWAWKTPDEVLEAIVPFKRAVYEQVFALFRDRI